MLVIVLVVSPWWNQCPYVGFVVWTLCIQVQYLYCYITDWLCVITSRFFGTFSPTAAPERSLFWAAEIFGLLQEHRQIVPKIAQIYLFTPERTQYEIYK